MQCFLKLLLVEIFAILSVQIIQILTRNTAFCRKECSNLKYHLCGKAYRKHLNWVQKHLKSCRSAFWTQFGCFHYDFGPLLNPETPKVMPKYFLDPVRAFPAFAPVQMHSSLLLRTENTSLHFVLQSEVGYYICIHLEHLERVSHLFQWYFRMPEASPIEFAFMRSTVRGVSSWRHLHPSRLCLSGFKK